jgi:hypothetical protein
MDTINTHPDRLKRFNTKKPKVFAIWNDLLHESIDRHFIESSLTAMYYQPFNTFLILTKRPERFSEISRLGHWPYENVYLGLTVCNQQEADEKIPIFLQVPGKKFLNMEPMLSDINLGINIKRIGYAPFVVWAVLIIGLLAIGILWGWKASAIVLAGIALLAISVIGGVILCLAYSKGKQAKDFREEQEPG